MRRFLLLFPLFLALGLVSLNAQQVVVKPYLQPGDASTLGDYDSRLVCWVTDGGDASAFSVEFGGDENYGHKATINSVELPIPGSKYQMHRATLSGFPLDTKVYYKVAQGDQVIRKSVFQSRSKPGSPLTFVAVGDLSKQRSATSGRIPFQIAQKAPQMGVIVGDIAYQDGLFSDYLDHYVSIYINEDQPNPEIGAPVLAQSTFYFAVGNHDIRGHDFKKYPDGLAAFYMWQSPLNGPLKLPFVTSPKGPSEQVKAFKAACGQGFPGLFNYSFDNGPAHFVVLDANSYVNVANKEWTNWMENDLKSSKARWKFVCFHQPPFNTSDHHYDEQRMRVFSPLFERCGVDVVLNGHVHNYQRSKPLTFLPSVDVEKMATALATSKLKMINGHFTIDNDFNGVDKTSPKGIVYIVTGAGGAEAHDVDFTNNPSKWVHKDKENWAPFTQKFISGQPSFSYMTVDNNTFDFKQIDESGAVIDSFKITK